MKYNYIKFDIYEIRSKILNRQNKFQKLSLNPKSSTWFINTDTDKEEREEVDYFGHG